MEQQSPIALRVGIFATIAVLLLLGLSLSVTGTTLGGKSYEVVAYFKSAAGLETGSRVALRGVPIGQVRTLSWDPQRLRVRTVLRVKEEFRIPRGAYAVVRPSSLLGGVFVDISFDDAQALSPTLLAQGDELETRDIRSIDDAIQEVAAFGASGTKLFESVDQNQRQLVAKVNAVIDENRENIRAATTQLAELGPKAQEIMERISSLTRQVDEGQGTLGALWKDKSLYDQFQQLGRDAKEIAQQIRSGEGSIGKLIYDDTLAKEAQALLTKIGNAADQVQATVGENREPLNKLMIALSNAGPKIEGTLTNFEQISAKVNRGEGTLGKLVNDPSLYEDTKRAVNQVGESFEGGEEQGVIRSFFGILFGALI